MWHGEWRGGDGGAGCDTNVFSLAKKQDKGIFRWVQGGVAFRVGVKSMNTERGKALFPSQIAIRACTEISDKTFKQTQHFTKFPKLTMRRTT